MATVVSAFLDETPIFQATNASTERQPVIPASSSRSISAMMSTSRPSMALRCPHSSAISPNSASKRSFGGAKDAAVVDISPLFQRGPTSRGHSEDQ